LLIKAGCGYELSNDDINSCVSGVWQVPQQQIYRELKKMEAEGWLRSKTVCQEKKLDKKVYEITEAGRQHLMAWLQKPVEPAATRDALLVKIFSGHLIESDLILAEIERHRQLHQAQLDWFESIRESCFSEPDLFPPEKNFQYLVLLHRIGEERHWIDWCSQAKNLLKPALTTA
jgi:DNA-binding PadR family transcriptional regulator